SAKHSDHLPTVDGWRAVAILLVLAYHSSLSLNAHSRLFGYGRMGVDLFFAISGFLITYRLITEYQSSGRIALKNFYIRRVFRILPPAFLYLSVIALLTMFGVLRVRSTGILAAVFFLTNYVNPAISDFSFVAHFWSLSVEEHFYLLWPGALKSVGVRFG